MSTSPRCKINVAGTDYESIASYVNVKRRENNYDVATINIPDVDYTYYNTFAKFAEIKVYFKPTIGGTYVQVFGGYIHQKNPTQTDTRQTILNCKGYGAALEATNCNRDYGSESSNPSYPATWNILGNTIVSYVNKSFNDTNTGYALNKDYISDYCSTYIKYINNPYRSNLDLVNSVCKLTSAIGAGTTAGGHWIVDNSNRFLFAKIGDHAAGGDSPETYWPDWWNTDQAGSTLKQASPTIEGDFYTFDILDKAEEYANNVLLLTDFRRPAYDAWTGNSTAYTLWGNDGTNPLTSITASTSKVVGTHSVKFTVAAGTAPGLAHYPSTVDAAWDVTRWGSAKTVPTLNFYSYASTDTIVGQIFLEKASGVYYYSSTNWLVTEKDKWLSHSVPIGPYWLSSKDAEQYKWTAYGGISDWTEINYITIYATGSPDSYILLNDVHFNGKIIRSAKHSQAITANKEHQKVSISRNSMDDSCVASDDTGYAGRLAYAELLRRIYDPKTIQFTTTTNMLAAMAGQKIHVHAGLKADASYVIDADMRIVELQPTYDAQNGLSFTVTATTDLKNSFPINIPDQYAMWQENMFVNSAEAKNIRSGAEVDLLIPQLIKDYGP